MRNVIRPLISDAVIAEHRQLPNGPHSDDLARILNYFRRVPAPGKYALYAERPFAAYRIVKLAGVRGGLPQFIDDAVYDSEDAAAHAVFLRRLADLGRALSTPRET
jgi:hypothetical protein